MTAVISLLVVLTMSFLITRFFGTALHLTGLSRPLARLQAVSAFTGVGFTTRESESIVTHPARRRMLIVLMILGNAGFVTAASSLILSFVDTPGGSDMLTRISILVVGVAVLAAIMLSKWVDRQLERMVSRMLQRMTKVIAIDFASLLRLDRDYMVREIQFSEGDWVVDRELKDLMLQQEGVTVLGIHREGEYLGVPRGETIIRADDRVVLYGTTNRLAELAERKRGAEGDTAHDDARRAHREERHEQDETAREIGDPSKDDDDADDTKDDDSKDEPGS